MTTIECPFSDQPLELDLATAVDAACDTCQVRVELAADPLPLVVAAAA